MPRKSRENVVQAQITELQQELVEIRRNKRWLCPYCGKKSRMRDLNVADVDHYISPYSCSGGDYWTHSHYEVTCPKCGEEERTYPKTEYQDERVYPATQPPKEPQHSFISSNRALFKSFKMENK